MTPLPTTTCKLCGEFVPPAEGEYCPNCRSSLRLVDLANLAATLAELAELARQRRENAKCRVCKQTIFDPQGYRFEPNVGYIHLGCLEPEQGGHVR